MNLWKLESLKNKKKVGTLKSNSKNETYPLIERQLLDGHLGDHLAEMLLLLPTAFRVEERALEFPNLLIFEIRFKEIIKLHRK